MFVTSETNPPGAWPNAQACYMGVNMKFGSTFSSISMTYGISLRLCSLLCQERFKFFYRSIQYTRVSFLFCWSEVTRFDNITIYSPLLFPRVVFELIFIRFTLQFSGTGPTSCVRIQQGCHFLKIFGRHPLSFFSYGCKTVNVETRLSPDQYQK